MSVCQKIGSLSQSISNLLVVQSNKNLPENCLNFRVEKRPFKLSHQFFPFLSMFQAHALHTYPTPFTCTPSHDFRKEPTCAFKWEPAPFPPLSPAIIISGVSVSDVIRCCLLICLLWDSPSATPPPTHTWTHRHPKMFVCCRNQSVNEH